MANPIFVVDKKGRTVPVKLSDLRTVKVMQGINWATWVLIALNVIQTAALVYLAVR